MLPVGGFLLQHFFSNSYIFISDQAYDEHTKFLTGLPMVVLLELSLIYLPILLHAALGVAIIYRGEQNFASYGRFRNWMYFFQRLTGLIAFAFIATHTYTTRIQGLFFGKEINAEHMTQVLKDPFWFWFYAVGMVTVVFHFSNGLWSFLITWGITVGKKAQQMVGALSMGLFVVMTVWGFMVLLKFN